MIAPIAANSFTSPPPAASFLKSTHGTSPQANQSASGFDSVVATISLLGATLGALGALLKYQDDIERIAGEEATRLVSEAKSVAATA